MFEVVNELLGTVAFAESLKRQANYRVLRVILVVAASGSAFLCGCAAERPQQAGASAFEAGAEQDVEAALARYRDRIKQMDAPAIAALFTDAATISHEDQVSVGGREAIRLFMESFKGYQVVLYDIEADTTIVSGHKATQVGRYRQVVLAPDGATIKVEGSFRAEWRWGPEVGWLIRTMRTASAYQAP